MLKIKWTDRIMKDEVFQRAKEKRLLLKILQNIPVRHSWIGRTIRHNEFVVNILEGEISFLFISLSYGRSKASSKTSFPHSAI